MFKFKQLLQEKTFDVDKDVDYIYNKYVKDWFEMFQYVFTIPPDKWGGASKIDYKFSKMLSRLDYDYIPEYVVKEFDTGELKSDDCKRGHELHPCVIRFGVFSSSSYNPSNQVIYLSFVKSLVQLVLYKYRERYSLYKDRIKKWNMEKAIEIALPLSKVRSAKLDLSEFRIKKTIAHELSHWLDDATHNFYIKSFVHGDRQLFKFGVRRQNDFVSDEPNFTKFEINAQIHALKQTKREYSDDEFDKLSFFDFIFRSRVDSVFYRLAYQFVRFERGPKKRDELYKLYVVRLVNRMMRENLWGKSMRPPTQKEIIDFWKKSGFA